MTNEGDVMNVHEVQSKQKKRKLRNLEAIFYAKISQFPYSLTNLRHQTGAMACQRLSAGRGATARMVS
jgi:hypothetical protein